MGQKRKYSQEEVDELFKRLENTTAEELVKKVRDNNGQLEVPKKEEESID